MKVATGIGLLLLGAAVLAVGGLFVVWAWSSHMYTVGIGGGTMAFLALVVVASAIAAASGLWLLTRNVRNPGPS